MKKRFLLPLLCFAIAFSLVSPSLAKPVRVEQAYQHLKECTKDGQNCVHRFAVSVSSPDHPSFSRREEAYEHLKECAEGGAPCTHQYLFPRVADDVKPHLEATPTGRVWEYVHETEIQQRWRGQQACAHQNHRIFLDAAHGFVACLCLDCGVSEDLEVDALSAEAKAAAVSTSTAVQGICVHEFGDWAFYDENDHRRSCEKCGAYEYGSHDRVSADCETDEHCSTCGGAYSTWELHWGHDMGYYCPDPVFGSTHEYRCVRTNNDLELICGYVASVESCNFYTIVESASDGIHDIWQMCADCGNPQDLDDAECSAPRACWLCTQVG